MPHIPQAPSLLVKYHNKYYNVWSKLKLGYAQPGDGGIDLYSAISEDIILQRGQSVNIDAGVSVKVPDGYVGLIRGRSSTFYRRGLFVVHNTIDSQFTGNLFITIWNPGVSNPEHTYSNNPSIIKPWERLGQLVVVPAPYLNITEVDQMPITMRSSNGLGSSGV